MSTREPTGLPAWAFLPALVGALLVVLPLVALVAEVPWRDFIALVTSESARAALALSLRTAAASTAICLVLGVPMALFLARAELRGISALRAVVLLPLVLPPAVAGVFTISVDGVHTSLLPYDASEAAVQAALASLLPGVSVQRNSTPGAGPGTELARGRLVGQRELVPGEDVPLRRPRGVGREREAHGEEMLGPGRELRLPEVERNLFRPARRRREARQVAAPDLDPGGLEHPGADEKREVAERVLVADAKLARGEVDRLDLHELINFFHLGERWVRRAVGKD